MYLCMINVNYNDHVLAKTRTILLTHNTPIYTHRQQIYNAYITPVTNAHKCFYNVKTRLLVKLNFIYINSIRTCIDNIRLQGNNFTLISDQSPI